jgi:hypothetical protein
MNKFSKLAAAAALAVAGVGAQAAFVIDDFSINQPQLLDNTIGPVPASTLLYGTNLAGGVGSSVIGPAANIIGGQRDLMVYKTGQDGTGAPRNVEGVVDGGLFTFSSPSQTRGFAVLRWDGLNTYDNPIDTSGLGGLDLSLLGLGIRISSEADLPYQIVLQAWTETTPGNWTVSEITKSAPGGQVKTDLNFMFSDFAGANFASLGALQLIVNLDGATTALDVDIEIIANTVPEPGTLALVGATLLGLGAARRRAKKG